MIRPPTPPEAPELDVPVGLPEPGSEIFPPPLPGSPPPPPWLPPDPQGNSPAFSGRRTEPIGCTDDGDRVVAQVRPAGGGDETCEAVYIAGCDGARSLVREKMGVGFPGGTYQQAFYVADVEASGPALDGELHVDLDDADFLAVFPLAGQGRARLIGTVRGERAERAETLRIRGRSATEPSRA